MFGYHAGSAWGCKNSDQTCTYLLTKMKEWGGERSLWDNNRDWSVFRESDTRDVLWPPFHPSLTWATSPDRPHLFITPTMNMNHSPVRENLTIHCFHSISFKLSSSIFSSHRLAASRSQDFLLLVLSPVVLLLHLLLLLLLSLACFHYRYHDTYGV